ncbi:biotin carboxyl carrier domain-containing protein [Amycolatopsis rubida]|uniref:Biotin carboxyl carrier protein of acetyl-CoA carboxylase n=1 Tax=Amycolatopsis rubida TaxID=112413 RepID=A0A1I5PTE3_9PSEU|nr:MULTISPECIES: acetyl-CoA carboxylase [Amycolatopsis]MYW92640.1 biotin carboxyl carrier domain-containing protein [Amycolatopsis rubida]NEC57625.1 biotin carboxyl carrier domain-containing protein [Amycolatopsis rubida]OAP26280.1 Biotin carboxyl carrier protein of acetyl-CoA carboxylase [Amycolatopsis sp. M39]SFP36831.1 Biotin-requiring enzyme [Amycolatopsis rubida]
MSRLEVVSPIPGVFYRRPDPESPDFVKPGQQVGADDTVGLVEVMKSFYPVPAGAAGTVVEFAAGAEAVVDAGQPLVVLEVDA